MQTIELKNPIKFYEHNKNNIAGYKTLTLIMIQIDEKGDLVGAMFKETGLMFWGGGDLENIQITYDTSKHGVK